MEEMNKHYTFTMDYDYDSENENATYTIQNSFCGTREDMESYRNGLYRQGCYNIDTFCFEDECL